MIVGLCRFSYLSAAGGGGWKKMPSDVEQARRALFEDVRLETRFKLFEAYTLPSIRQQTDGDFTFVIMTSSHMPKLWLDRLRDLVVSDPRIKVRALPAQRMGSAIKEIFAEEFAGTDRKISFRLDDDDGLSVNFIRRIRQAYDAVRLDDPFFVTFSKGVVVAYKGDRIGWASECSDPFFSAGMALSTSGANSRYVYSFGHVGCHRLFDGVVLSGAPGFVRCLHGFNSALGKLKGTTRGYARTSLSEIAQRYREDFPYLADVS